VIFVLLGPIFTDHPNFSISKNRTQKIKSQKTHFFGRVMPKPKAKKLIEEEAEASGDGHEEDYYQDDHEEEEEALKEHQQAIGMCLFRVPVSWIMFR
jgi:hypothetical protein